MSQEWKLLPATPTPEMIEAGEPISGLVGSTLCYRAMLAAAPLPPNETMTLEEARSGQHWRGMDGACAWHLIYRHADGWGEIATMMQAWLDANRETPNVGGEARLAAHQPSHTTTATPQGVASTDQLGRASEARK